ncbi:unnamed protein product [Pleuronectes platessa]|uniref:Uncharacterized protein n=1 Tax=Pleuronectes platessa TaxID=8262 RepID=A0A9N7YWT3_PLEPL|nr:unnamed protein product [Pleuronectes platessa]
MQPHAPPSRMLSGPRGPGVRSLSGPRGPGVRSLVPVPGARSRPPPPQLSGLSLLGPMKSSPSTGMSLSLMAACTQRWYFRKVSVHGSPPRSPFRNFSANQRLKHWSYSRFSSVHASPTLFISAGNTRATAEGFEPSTTLRYPPRAAGCDWLLGG